MEITKSEVEELITQTNEGLTRLKRFTHRAISELSQNGYSLNFIVEHEEKGHVIASFSGSDVRVNATAKCRPGDAYSFELGRAIAVKKVLENLLGDEYKL